MEWNEIAFSYNQIEDYLSLIALPDYEINKILPFGSKQHKCFGIGFYFFVYGIKNELNEELGENLLNLASRVEHAAIISTSDTRQLWQQNSETAINLLKKYFYEKNA